MSKQKRDVWCDHCDYRFAIKINGREGVGVCPNCGKPTLLVTCDVCDNQSELTHVNFEKSNWICPQCKEYREFSAETITDFLTAQISVEPAERVRRRWQPSLKVGCITLVFLYAFSAFLLSSCGNLFSREPDVIVQEVAKTVVDMTATSQPKKLHEAFPESSSGIETRGLYRHDVETGTVIQVTHFSRTFHLADPTWTTDARYVVFSVDRDRDLYALDPYSGEKPVRLFDTPIDEISATFHR